MLSPVRVYGGLTRLLAELRLSLVSPTIPSSFRFLHHAARRLAINKPFYVTTPIFYVNAEPHIGHLHSLVLADVLKRWHRLRDGKLRGEPVLLTGTDEHGMKIQKVAQARNIPPKELCDQVSLRFRALAEAVGADCDVFMRTTEARHAKTVQHVWRELERKGLIYKAHYEGWYSVSDEAYYSENQVRDEVGPTGAPMKVAIETSQPVEWMQEENYMFKLGSFKERLINWLKANPQAVRPQSRYNELLTSLEKGPLGDLSISRPRARLEWGIQVPDDASHTVYVWIDALTNYLTATGYPEKAENTIWPADVHVIGKDILRFHAVYWPAMLMALDLPLPGTVLAHAHWTMGQFKMSKSRGNVVNPFAAIERFTKDGIRYFLMSKGGLDSDSDFSEQHVERDYRKELAGQAGNLVQRLRSKGLVKKMSLGLSAIEPAAGGEAVVQLQNKLNALPDRVNDAMLAFEPSRALEAVNQMLGEINAWMAQEEPWKLNDAAQLALVLPLCIEAVRKCSLLLQPFIPDSASALLDRLGVPPTEREWGHLVKDETGTGMSRMVEAVQQQGQMDGVFVALRDEDRKTRLETVPKVN